MKMGMKNLIILSNGENTEDDQVKRMHLSERLSIRFCAMNTIKISRPTVVLQVCDPKKSVYTQYNKENQRQM